MSRTVFISVPHGTSAGNMLRSGGLLDRILESDASLSVVLLSPMSKDPQFVREFERPRVTFVDQPAHVPSGLEARLLAIVQASYLSQGQTESVRIRLAEARANGIIRWLGVKGLIGRVLVQPFTRNGSRYAMSDRFVSHAGMETLFELYRPVLVIAANPGLVFSEVPLLRTAKRRGVRSMAIDPSWDNFTNKLIPVRQVDRLVVWNDIMKEQAVSLHGYDPSAISVAGAPQFDPHFRARTPRADFFARIGADPARKLIALTTTPRSLYSHHDYVLRALVNAMNTGALTNAQVLVRLHPRDEFDAYKEFANTPHVIIEKPFRDTVKVADGLAIDVMPENQKHLGDTLHHADVVVNVASTISIEACIFDTPVVNINFDGRDVSPYVKSARRYYSFTHYVNITSRGAVRVATSPEELVREVAAYLADPSRDSSGRKQVVLDQCQFTDGRSAERVVRLVLDELGAAAARAAA
ncbi:MAG TPA: CDP-glycerol glycerophosphotransferase family protein [Vicinamibacterales bacterium]|nr:CDP-glycerol glycerophosphotransferase family protein [Vicinamibacterales bacterium]